MFPFQWSIKGFEHQIFSEQISLKNIDYALYSNWERSVEPTSKFDSDVIYNERNYFYEFVHDALYDSGDENSLVRHFERKETKEGDVSYVINCGGKVYELKVYAININLYSTGVGMLSFYLNNEKYPDPSDVLMINQVGRRVFPPFIASVEDRGILANSIEIKGLQGKITGYIEDFSRYTNKTKNNMPASFLVDMIHEVAKNIDVKPVVDDRMFLQCWYKNDEWTNAFKNDYESFLNSNPWYEFVFVDKLNDISCKNKDMQYKLIKEATYERWQENGSLYGISRYSMMYTTSMECPKFLLDNFETMYARMAELILVQKASVLRFSAEVTNISKMDVEKDFSEKVSSLYKEYIRFVNQIHFREVSAQDQGIELYQMLYGVMNIGEHVSKLDEEISELHTYVSLREDRRKNSTMELLTTIATIAVPLTVVAGFFGMNNKGLNDEKGDYFYNYGLNQFYIAILVAIIISVLIWFIKRSKK